MNKPLIIIPARMASKRFPGKVLEKIHGKPMLKWVVEGCPVGVNVVVATTDPEIVRIVEFWDKENVTAELTDDHHTMLDRCSEIANNHLFSDPIIVAQGDEPMMQSMMISDVIRHYRFYGNLCLVKPIGVEESESVDTIKVVTDAEQNVMYMSRYPIPGMGKDGYSLQRLKHVGVMAFAQKDMARFGTWGFSGAERSEGIDMLRFLYHGVKIHAISSYTETKAVDTPEDLIEVERLMKEKGMVVYV